MNSAPWKSRLAANEQNQAAVEQLEDAASRSRSVTQRIATAEQQLDAVSAAGLLVNAELDYLDSLGATDFPELSRTIELLYDLIPGRAR